MILSSTAGKYEGAHENQFLISVSSSRSGATPSTVAALLADAQTTSIAAAICFTLKFERRSMN
jgi:hypothetical protein